MFVYYPSGAQDNQDLWVFVFDFTGPKRDTSQQVIILPLNYIKCVLFVPGLIRALFVLQRVKPSLNYDPSQHQALSQIIVKYDSDILRGKGILQSYRGPQTLYLSHGTRLPSTLCFLGGCCMGTNILAINRYDWCSYYLSAKYPMFSMAIFTFCDFFFFNLSLDKRGHVE